MPILEKPPSCVGCPLATLGQGFSEPEGQGTLGVLILGEALGEQELTAGLPFRPYAPAGSILERAIKRCGFTREQFVLWNTVACRPPGNRLEGAYYERGAVNYCKQHTRVVVDRFRPRCILALGAVALRAATGYAGKDCGISDLRGFVLDSQEWGLPVVPAYHPSYIRRGNADYLGCLMRDIKLAVQVAATGRPQSVEQQYNEVPTIAEAQAYLDLLKSDPLLTIAYDIETDYSHRSSDESEALVGTGNKVTQIQFSHRPGQAIVFQWVGAYKEIARAILALPNPKIAHNGWLFDELKLALPENGSVVVAGVTEDTMWLWHHLQPDLPKKLQYVTSFYDPGFRPWKHLAGSDMTFYGGSDVDVLQRIYPTLVEQLKKEGLYDSYCKYVRDLYPCLRRMSERGLPINLVGREALREEVIGEQRELYERIQQYVAGLHPGLIRVHPEQGYVQQPKDTRGLEHRTFSVVIPCEVQCPVCSARGSVEGKRPGTTKQCPKCKGRTTVRSNDIFTQADVLRWCRIDGFNPDSPVQLFSYMSACGHPIPVDREGRRTSDDDALGRLFGKTKDPLYDFTLHYRKLGKIVETYLDGKGWTPSAAGRIHSQFGYGPATWQLNSRDPNVQNIPKHGEVATRFRGLVMARPGYRLVEFDYSGFHALTLGFEAGDETYMRLARLDPHSFLAGQFLKLEGHEKWLSLGWQELAEILSWVKKNHKDIRDQKAKPAMHGYGFGMGGSKLFYLNPDSFDSKQEAQYVVDLLDRSFPKIPLYRSQVRQEAHSKGFLKTRYGAIRRFYDVYTWSQGAGDWRAGEQYNEVVAFRPSNDAFGKVRDCMLELEADGSNEEFGLILNGHDSLMYECSVDRLERCLERVTSCMESPALPLVDPMLCPGGLRTGIEAFVGETWTTMESVYKTPLEGLM